VEDGENLNLVVNVNDVQTSLFVVKERLLRGGAFSGCDKNCSDCGNHENGCVKLKEGIQELMNEGCLQFDRVVKDREEVSTVTIYFTPSEGPVHTPRTISAPVTIGTPVTVVAPVTISAPVTVGVPVIVKAPVTISTPTTIVASSGRLYENSRAIPWQYDNASCRNRRPENQTRSVN
jgi:hypothetical protein